MWGCSGKQADSDAASASPPAAATAETAVESVDAQPALHDCESRSFDAAGADVMLTTNLDGSLAAVKVQNAAAGARAQILAAVRQRFGAVKHDSRTSMHLNKWGLNVMMDACGRPLDLSGSAKATSGP
jgi:hypothetical protein